MTRTLSIVSEWLARGQTYGFFFRQLQGCQAVRHGQVSHRASKDLCLHPTPNQEEKEMESPLILEATYVVGVHVNTQAAAPVWS